MLVGTQATRETKHAKCASHKFVSHRAPSSWRLLVNFMHPRYKQHNIERTKDYEQGRATTLLQVNSATNTAVGVYRCWKNKGRGCGERYTCTSTPTTEANFFLGYSIAQQRQDIGGYISQLRGKQTTN